MLAPSEATNIGSNGKFISVPTSVKKLVSPSAMTAGGKRGRMGAYGGNLRHVFVGLLHQEQLAGAGLIYSLSTLTSSPWISRAWIGPQ